MHVKYLNSKAKLSITRKKVLKLGITADSVSKLITIIDKEVVKTKDSFLT